MLYSVKTEGSVLKSVHLFVIEYLFDCILNPEGRNCICLI